MATKEFELMRAQILALSANPAAQHLVPQSEVFAWSSRLSPVFSGNEYLEAFEDEFRVKAKAVDTVIKFLDDHWRDDSDISFYNMEEKFGGKYGPSQTEGGLGTSRTDLINICRYAFIDGRFDEALWQRVLADAKHPIEASGIVRKVEWSEFHL